MIPPETDTSATAVASHAPRPRAYHWLRRVSLLAQAHGDRAAREHGVTLGQWELLMRLRCCRGGALDQRELCSGFGVTPSTVTALVDAAEAHGWIERRPYPGDRRRRTVALTAEGRAFAASLPPLGRTINERLTDGFSDDERELLADLLQRAAENLRRDGAR